MQASDLLLGLKSDGAVPLGQLLPESMAETLDARLELLITEGNGLSHPRADSAVVQQLLEADDWASVHEMLNDPKYKIDPSDIANGPATYRDRVYHVTAKDSLIAFPELIDITYSPEILELASNYFGDSALVDYVKIKKSFSNDLPPTHTNLFHVDDNADKILKVILYFTTVDQNSGPFNYVAGSHTDKFAGWNNKVFWPDSHIFDNYPSVASLQFTGRRGFAVMADTKGFHREQRQSGKDRSVAIISYVAKTGYAFKGFGELKLPKEKFTSFDPTQQAAAQLCELI